MKVYELLWILFRHALKGRFRDELFVSVELDTPQRLLAMTGVVVSFTPESREEGFCILDAICEDEAPWSEWPDFEPRATAY